MEIALFIAAGVLLVGGIIFLFYWFEKKRADAMREIAGKLECAFIEKDPSLHTELSAFHLFKSGHSHKSYNIIKSEKDSWDVAAFDYKYTIGSGNNQTTYHQTVVRVKAAGLSLPHFELRPETMFHKIGGLFGYQDIDFNDYPDFSKKFLLKGQNEGAVREAFSESVIRFFENHRLISAEGNGETLFVYRRGKRIKPIEIEEKIKEALELLACFVGAKRL